MKKKIVFLSLIVTFLLSFVYIGCEKTSTNYEPKSFESEANTVSNSTQEIVSDDNWKQFILLHGKYLNLIVNCAYPLNGLQDMKDKEFLEAIGLDELSYKADLKRMNELATKVKDKYFKGIEECKDCSIMNKEKWSTFKTQIFQFRTDKIAYIKALKKIGLQVDIKTNSVVTIEDDEFDDDGNYGCGWRFYLCAAACGLTSGPAAVACVAACYSAFC